MIQQKAFHHSIIHCFRQKLELFPKVWHACFRKKGGVEQRVYSIKWILLNEWTKRQSSKSDVAKISGIVLNFFSKSARRALVVVAQVDHYGTGAQFRASRQYQVEPLSYIGSRWNFPRVSNFVPFSDCLAIAIKSLLGCDSRWSRIPPLRYVYYVHPYSSVITSGPPQTSLPSNNHPNFPFLLFLLGACVSLRTTCVRGFDTQKMDLSHACDQVYSSTVIDIFVTQRSLEAKLPRREENVLSIS